MSKEAMKLALEALEEATTYTNSTSFSPSLTRECKVAATALRKALAEQPAQRTWVGLTDEDIAKLDLSAVTVKDATSDVRAIEAKLNEKNT